MNGAAQDLDVDGRVKPRLRGRLHQGAFVACWPMGTWLLLESRTAVEYVASAVYLASSLALFGTSASYHRGRWSKPWQLRMQRLDHAMIFVLIAGTFTPIALLAMRRSWGIALLFLCWTGALGGVVCSLAWFDWVDRNERRFYIGFGWLLALALPAAAGHLTLAELLVLLIGGLIYTIGAAGFSLERPDPRPLVFGYHEVWHLMTVLAAGCHFTFVFLLVRA